METVDSLEASIRRLIETGKRLREERNRAENEVEKAKNKLDEARKTIADLRVTIENMERDDHGLPDREENKKHIVEKLESLVSRIDTYLI